MAWLPASYAWGNFTVLALGVWAIAQRDSVDAVILFLVGLLLTILTDIIHFSVFFAATSNAAEKQGIEDFFRFSAGMAILSLILKPLSCFFVYFMYRERGGEHNLNFGFFTAPQDRSAYQSIDQQDAPTDQDSKMPQRQY
ncbi:type-1 angiotensin II receptor-associated protein isoform X3 [Pleurodeles waltl]